MNTTTNFSCFSSNLSHVSLTPGVWTAPEQGDTNYQQIYSSPFLLIYISLGVPWNSLVIGTILWKRLHLKPTYIFLLNLALTDLLVCILFMPFDIISGIAREFIFGPSDYVRCQVCYTVVIITIVFLFVLTFTITSMSIDRVLYLKIPLTYEKHVTTFRATVAVILTWVTCIMIAIPPVFGFGDVFYSKDTGSCTLLLHNETSIAKTIYYGLVLILISAISYTSTLVCNIWLLWIIRKSLSRKNRGKEVATATSKHQFNKQQIRLAQVFGAIFFANTALWIPIYLHHIARTSC